MNKKIILISIISTILLILSITLAWLRWNSEDNLEVKFSIGQLAEVSFKKGNDIVIDNLAPVLDYNDGEITEFTIRNNSDLDLITSIKLNITVIDDELKSESFKYILLSSIDENNYNEVTSGNFVNITNSEIILEDIKTKVGTTYYKFIIYLDGNIENNINMMNKNFTGTITVDVLDKYKITLITDSLILNEGTILTNLVPNGSFEDGGKNWNLGPGIIINSEQHKFGNNAVKNYQTAALAAASTSIPVIENHKYYLSGWLYGNKTTCYNDSGFIVNGVEKWTDGTALTNDKLNTWVKISIIKVAPANSSVLIALADSPENKEGTGLCYGDGASLIDLTQSFGEGHEPNKNWLDTYLPYIEESGQILEKEVREKDNLIIDFNKNINGSLSCDNNENVTLSNDNIIFNNVNKDITCTITTS